jgi:hypothetical protein
MSAPISMQVDGLRVLAKRLSAVHLVRSGAVARKPEAEHLIDMLRDAAETLETAYQNGEVS